MNPYRVGPWVVGSEFYARGNLLRDIILGPADSLWIIGNRRVGKTSLLRAVEHQTANSAQYMPLFWDMQGDTSEAELMESFFESTENAQWGEVDTRWGDFELPENVNNISQALRRVGAYARKFQCRLLLLCDEIEGLSHLGEKEPHTLSKLRRIMQHNPAIRTVLASTRRLSRLYSIQQQQDASLFLEGLEPRYLTVFDDTTANQLICRTQSAQPLTVDENQLTKIRFFAGNHPLILQKICSQLFEADKHILRSFSENEFILDDQLSGTFQQDFDALTPDEANILLHIKTAALLPEEIEQAFPNLSKQNLLRILYDLTHLGFLRRIEKGYQTGNVPLGFWLATNPTHHAAQVGVTNRMLRKVAQERITSLQRQLIVSYRYLARLNEQKATQGIHTPPGVLLEIEDYKKTIVDIQAELAELQVS
ncbi:MAG: hypothetical protein KDJ52_18295 [Anaerolineae bacterium]|nr:hypothetical protein [Anaerolineae bacterium]